MCGIVGAVAQRDIVPILLEGLKRSEYRGYDSAGIAVLTRTNQLKRIRTCGKVARLVTALQQTPLQGTTGIAHTRWATHGIPNEKNAHPHLSNDELLAIVHNGIVECHEKLRQDLSIKGYNFLSETDTEAVVHAIHYHISVGKEFLLAVCDAIKSLTGAYALGIINAAEPDRLIAVRCGSPLVIGLGFGENFIASDPSALFPVTHRFIYLEEGDIADIRCEQITIYNSSGEQVQRAEHLLDAQHDSNDKHGYRHFMLKEIFEQADAVRATLEGRLTDDCVDVDSLGKETSELFKQIKHVQIVACGTSYHAGLVARYWLESLAHIPCQVEIASEFRYRQTVVLPNTLLIAISQSGETADTLAALRLAKTLGYRATLAICNVAESSLVREAELQLMTHAGKEIGVASTKAFTTQLVALLLLTALFSRNQSGNTTIEKHLVAQLKALPTAIQAALQLDNTIKQLAYRLVEKQHVLFLGRGTQFPIALEGALKLKELSYIHAEAYPAGELKHGPLALVDKNMPVIIIAPTDELLEKLKSNLQEVRARGGELLVFTDADSGIKIETGITIIPMARAEKQTAPIIYTIPLQLLAYHVAVLRGTDVDQPRNLAKSVTVE